MARAIAKAAPAATLPIKVVWRALLKGLVPVNRPFTYPKANNAKRVIPTEMNSAFDAECVKIYGASGTKPPAT